MTVAKRVCHAEPVTAFAAQRGGGYEAIARCCLYWPVVSVEGETVEQAELEEILAGVRDFVREKVVPLETQIDETD